MEFNNHYKLMFNFEIEPTCQLYKNQLAYLKNLSLILKMFFHGFNFKFGSSKKNNSHVLFLC